MRALLLILTVVAVAAGLVITSALTLFSPPPPAMATTCQASLGPWPVEGGEGQGAADAAKLGEEQLSIVSAIITIGTQRQLSPRAWQIAIQAGMTESGLRNLNHGDRDSLGIFQMRPSMGWGTPAQLQDVSYQVNKFYDVLLTVPGWESMRPGDAAQAVERSGFPDRYHKWEALAVFLISQEGAVADPTGCGAGATGEVAQTVIDAAMTALGPPPVPYAWGGGNASGPTLGIRDGGVADQHGDYMKVGFDCSGLMLYAYAQAGITLPRVSSAQYHAGAHVPVDQAQPGDLVFWSNASGNPATIHHVAMYLGNGKIIEAPQSGDVVKISELGSRKSGLVANATRPGAPL